MELLRRLCPINLVKNKYIEIVLPCSQVKRFDARLRSHQRQVLPGSLDNLGSTLRLNLRFDQHDILGCLAESAPSDSADVIDLATGGRPVLYTDGLVEVFNEGEEMLAVSVHASLLPRLGTNHSHLIPVEDSARLERAVADALRETVGPDEASGLESRLLSDYQAPFDMPRAQALLLALRHVLPTVADPVLERTGKLYAA